VPYQMAPLLSGNRGAVTSPKIKPVSGVKPLAVKVPRTGSAGVCSTEASGSGEDPDNSPRGEKMFTLQELEVALASPRIMETPRKASFPGTGSQSWYSTPPTRSPLPRSSLFPHEAGRVRPFRFAPSPSFRKGAFKAALE
jgi:hypothetical protein